MRVYDFEQESIIIGRDDGADVIIDNSTKVGGESTKRAKLQNGDVVESGGLTLTFIDDMA